MKNLYKIFPELEGEELLSIQQLTQEMDDDELEVFAAIYRARRKDIQTMLILSLVGLFLLPGLQRFFVDQIGMGILYLFTGGLCIIGSIIDLINYKKLAFEYNASVAKDAMRMVMAG